MKLNPAINPEAGMVINQAGMVFLATPHRTADILGPTPMPMMLEEKTWVVETGHPTNAAPKLRATEEVWA